MRKYTRIIMLTLNIIAAIALLLAYVSCFVNPKTVWWLGIFGLAYMYLLIANICFMFFWIFFSLKTIYAMISCVIILLGWSFLAKNIQLFEKNIPKEKLSESIKIISFNVQGFLQMNKEQSDGEMLNMFDFFRKEEADIICMQEFVTDSRRNTDASNLRRRLNNTPYSHIELPGGYFGIATFSKYPIIRRETVYAQKSANACICSDIVIGKDTVRLYNIHLKSVGFNNDEMHLLNNMGNMEYDKTNLRTIISIFRNMKKSSLQREEQVEILMSHIEQSPYPVIICGDFNEPPISHSYRRIRGDRNDAFVKAGAGRSTTYDIGNIASLRIDYIMYSDHFKAYNYKSPRVFLSDHFPVMSRLTWERR